MVSRPDARSEGIASPRNPSAPSSPTATSSSGRASFEAGSTTKQRSRTFLRAPLPWLLIPAFGLVLIAAGWMALMHQLALDERRILDASLRDMESFVAAFEQYSLRTIKEADRTALLIKDQFEREGRIDLQAMMAKGLIPAEALNQIDVSDSSGNVIASTIDYNGPRNMADREYFQLHAAVDSGKLDIGKPIRGRVSGKTSIPLSRRLNNGDGSFAGLVVLQINPEHFTAFQSSEAREEVLAEFHERRTAYRYVGGVASLAVFVFLTAVTLLGMRLQRSHWRLWEARETLRAASDSRLDAFFLLRTVRDENGGVVDFMLRELNARGADLIGMNRQQAIGLSLSTLPIATTCKPIDKFARVVETGEPMDEEYSSEGEPSAAFWYRRQVVRVHDRIGITVRDITTRKRNEHEIQLQKKFLQTVLDNAPIGVMVRKMRADDHGKIVLMNETCAAMDGIDASRAIGGEISDVLPAEAAGRVLEMDRQMLASPMVQEVDMPIDSAKLGKRILHVVRAPIFDEHDKVDSIVSVLRDVTEEQARISELRLASKVFETTADAIVLTDADDRIIAVNKAFSKLTQFAAEEVVGQVFAESPFRPIDPAQSAERKARRRRDGFICCEVERFRKDGKRLALWVTGTHVIGETGKIVNYVRVFTDISTLKDSEEKLRQLASFDTLTGLPNRRLFLDRLQQAMVRATRSRNRMGLLFLDLDSFKEVNDTLGHDVGDRLLQEVTERLRDCVRGSDTLCRLGGDEFTIVVENARLHDDAIRVADRVVSILAEPFLLAGHEIRTTASIGIAIYPEDGVDALTLLKNADVAMYRAKKAGRNRYSLFSATPPCLPSSQSPPQPR